MTNTISKNLLHPSIRPTEVGQSVMTASTEAAARDSIKAALKSRMIGVPTSRSLTVDDLENILTVVNSGITITLPALGAIGVPIVIHALSNPITLVPASGVQLRASLGGTNKMGTQTVAAWSPVTIYQSGPAVWEMFGSGIS